MEASHIDIKKATIEALQVQPGRTFRPKNLWPTDFSEACARYLALKIKVINGELPAPPFETIRAGILGKWAHERVLRTLHAKGILKDIEVKVKGEWSGQLITGKLDGIFPGEKDLFEYKSLNGRSFERLRDLMPNIFADKIIVKYNRQAQIYMGLLPEIETCALQIHNADDPDNEDQIIYVVLPRNEGVISEMKDLLDYAVKSNKAKDGELPNRVALICPFCPFFEEHCNTIAFQPQTTSNDLIPHMATAEKMCRVSKELDARIKRYEKIQQSIKATLLSGLEKVGHQTGSCGEYTVNVSERERSYYPTELIAQLAEQNGIPKKITPYKVVSIRLKKTPKKIEKKAKKGVS